MIRFLRVYSASNTLKMKQNKLRAKKIRAGVRDLAYASLVLVIVGLVVSNIRLNTAIQQADSVLNHSFPQTNEVEQNIEAVKAKTSENIDERVVKLRAFLVEKNSPLAPYAELIVTEADKYDIGWTKLVSIACMESSCGHRLPTGSYNAWGLGGSNFMYFSSWEESIKYASKLLGTSYKQNENQGIKEKYCPASDGCNPRWAVNVTNTTNEILAMEAK